MKSIFVPVANKWQLPLTRRTSPMHPRKSVLIFALSFITIHSSLCQKERSHVFLVIKKMGSTQRDAVTAFLLEAISDDDTMVDRWIPDEDWVRRIRNNSVKDCTVWNLEWIEPS
jgi:hypothetical protein